MDNITYQRNRNTTRSQDAAEQQPQNLPAADPAPPTGGPSITPMERMMENMVQLMAMQQQRIDQYERTLQQQRAEMEARQRAPPPIVVQPPAQPLPGKIVSEFQKLKPPTFDGEAEAGGLDEWIDGMENCFRVQQSSEEDKILLAPFQLRKAAYNWWKQQQEELEGNNWEYFKEKLTDRFLPPAVKKQLRDSFLHLKQENMTVTEYEREFTRLLKYGAALVPTERAKLEHFKDGLRVNIKSFVTACMSTTLAGTLNCALEVEKVEKEKREQYNQGKRKGNHNSSESAKKQDIGENKSQGDRKNIKCHRCGQMGHYKSECPKKELKCTGCGVMGHMEDECRSKNITCNRCGQKGHYANRCSAPRKQEPGVKARVYTLTEVPYSKSFKFQ